MKLVSWNVNGLRACAKKGFFDYFQRADADVFCLQETKMQPHQAEIETPGYFQYWNSAEKKGYSGTAAFTRRELDARKPVVVCGDMNVAHEEIDLKNPKTNRGNAGFSDEERAKMTRLLASGFTDTFRYLYPDLAGAYSWWSYRFHAREKNAGWRIDYFLVSDRLRDRIEKAEIHADVLGSDHCPVSLTLRED